MAKDTVLEMFGGLENLDRYITTPESSAQGDLDEDGWSAAIELAAEEHLEDGARRHAARTIGALLLDRLDGSDRAAVSTMLAYPSASAANMARSRARQRAATAPTLLRAVADVISLAG